MFFVCISFLKCFDEVSSKWIEQINKFLDNLSVRKILLFCHFWQGFQERPKEFAYLLCSMLDCFKLFHNASLVIRVYLQEALLSQLFDWLKSFIYSSCGFSDFIGESSKCKILFFSCSSGNWNGLLVIFFLNFEGS